MHFTFYLFLILSFFTIFSTSELTTFMDKAFFEKIPYRRLKYFLKERGISCEDCNKAEYVEKAVKFKDKPVLKHFEHTKEESHEEEWIDPAINLDHNAPLTPLFKFWQKEAIDICREVKAEIKSNQPYEACDHFADEIVRLMRITAARHLPVLKKTEDFILSQSKEELVYTTGKHKLQKAAKEHLETPHEIEHALERVYHFPHSFVSDWFHDVIFGRTVSMPGHADWSGLDAHLAHANYHVHLEEGHGYIPKGHIDEDIKQAKNPEKYKKKRQEIHDYYADYYQQIKNHHHDDL